MLSWSIVREKVREGALEMLFQVSSLFLRLTVAVIGYSQTSTLFYHTSSLPCPRHTITLSIISGALTQHGPRKAERLDRWL